MKLRPRVDGMPNTGDVKIICPQCCPCEVPPCEIGTGSGGIDAAHAFACAGGGCQNVCVNPLPCVLHLTFQASGAGCLQTCTHLPGNCCMPGKVIVTFNASGACACLDGVTMDLTTGGDCNFEGSESVPCAACGGLDLVVIWSWSGFADDWELGLTCNGKNVSLGPQSSSSCSGGTMTYSPTVVGGSICSGGTLGATITWDPVPSTGSPDPCSCLDGVTIPIVFNKGLAFGGGGCQWGIDTTDGYTDMFYCIAGSGTGTVCQIGILLSLYWDPVRNQQDIRINVRFRDPAGIATTISITFQNLGEVPPTHVILDDCDPLLIHTAITGSDGTLTFEDPGLGGTQFCGDFTYSSAIDPFGFGFVQCKLQCFVTD